VQPRRTASLSAMAMSSVPYPRPRRSSGSQTEWTCSHPRSVAPTRPPARPPCPWPGDSFREERDVSCPWLAKVHPLNGPAGRSATKDPQSQSHGDNPWTFSAGRHKDSRIDAQARRIIEVTPEVGPGDLPGTGNGRPAPIPQNQVRWRYRRYSSPNVASSTARSLRARIHCTGIRMRKARKKTGRPMKTRIPARSSPPNT
jgi:hypothetical protein